MQILFLCGGHGSRLKEINKDLPKGLLPFNEKPFFDYIINSIWKFKPTSFHFCLGYKSQFYLEYLKNLKEKINISFCIEDEDNLLGTGGAIKNSIKFLEEDFIVQYGDTILDFDYKKFFNYHLKNQQKISMTVIHHEKSKEKPNLFCQKSLSNKKLICIYDKFNPLKNANYIDYGAMAFKKEVFENEKKNKFDLSELQNFLTLKYNAAFYEVNKPYIEIGNPTSFNRALKNLLR